MTLTTGCGAGAARHAEKTALESMSHHGVLQMRRHTASLWMILPLAICGIGGNTAGASPTTNLVVNGSFEGSNGLAGWSIGGSVSDGALPVAIAYNQASLYPTGAQDESVPTDNATSASPDPAGSKGVYFVSDTATNLSLFQYVFLTPGSYDIGFDSYATYNGYVQPRDANFTADIAGVRLADFNVSNAPPGIWVAHTGEALISTAGEYLVSFVFNTSNGHSKDVVIDRAFVIADQNGGGTPISVVSEPSTCMLIFGGLAMVVGTMRRARRGAPNARMAS